MAQDPIEQLFIELALKSEKFHKDVDEALSKAGKKTSKAPLPVPVTLDTKGFDKQINSALNNYKSMLKKSLGAMSLNVDTAQTEKGIKAAVALFMAEVPKLKKAGVVELTIAKDKLKASLDAAIKDTAQQIAASGVKGPGADFAKQATAKLSQDIADTMMPAQKATAGVSKELSGMAAVAKSTAQAMITNFAQTRDPISAMITGVQAANVGLQALAATGVVVDAVLSPLIAVLAALAAGVALVTVAIGPLIGFLKQTGEEGQRVAASVQTQWVGVRVAANNAGKSFDDVRAKVEQLQATGITTAESLSDMMLFLTNQLPIDNMDKLARSAQNVAIAFGADSSETMNRFVDAIVTGNTQLLQSVGITETATQMQERYALSINTTVGNLTLAQQKEAIMAGIMRDSQSFTGVYAASMESLGKQIGSLPRYIEEATKAFGDTLLPFLQQSVSQTTDFFKTFQGLFVQMKMVADAEGKMKPVAITGPTGQVQFTQLGQQIHDMVERITKATKPMFDAFIRLLPIVARDFGAIASQAQKVGVVLQPIGALVGNIITYFMNLGKIVTNAFSAIMNLPLPDFVKNIIGASTAADYLGKSIGLWAEIGAQAIGGLVGSLTVLSEMMVSITSLLSGQGAKGSWETWVQAGADAAKKIHDGLMDLGNVKVQPVVEPEIQLPPAGEMPNQQAMLNLQQETAAFKQMEQLQNGFQDQAIESRHQYDKQMETAVRESNRRLEDMTHDHNLNELRAVRDANVQKLYMARDYAINLRRSLEDFDTQTNRQNLQRTKEFNRSQVIALQQHLLDMQRTEEDFNFAIQDAARTRDARAILNLQRQHKVEVARKNEDFDISQKLSKQQLELQIEDQRIQREYLIQDAKKAYASEQEDFAKNLKDQKQARHVAWLDQLADKAYQESVEAKRRKEDFDLQQAEMEYQNGIRMEQLARQWAQNNELNAEAAKQLFTTMDTIFGAKGTITALLVGFNKNVDKTLKNLSAIGKAVGPLSGTAGGGGGSEGGGTEEDNYGAPPGAPPRPTTACGSGFEWRWDEDKAKWRCQRRHGGGRALGGLDIARRPTTVTFGEDGPEAALFLPMREGHTPLSKLGGMLSGASGGGKADRLDVGLHITSDGSITPEFEDKIYAGVAEIMAQQMGVRIETR